MPNVLIIKVANDHFMSQFKQSQDYSGCQEACDDLMDRHHGGATPIGMALCDLGEMAAAQEAGKLFDAGPGAGSDFNLLQKSAITTETVILPEGLTIGGIADSDWVVCYV